MTGGGSPQVRRNTGEGNDVTKQQVCEEEKLKLGSGVRQETEFLSHKSQDFITTITGEYLKHGQWDSGTGQPDKIIFYKELNHRTIQQNQRPRGPRLLSGSTRAGTGTRARLILPTESRWQSGLKLWPTWLPNLTPSSRKKSR